MSRWRAIDIHLTRKVLSEIGLRDLLWGMDIFVQGMPMIKLMILANVLVWALLWLYK